jgi:hypothetical protein
MKIHHVAHEFFHAERETDRHDEANSCFWQFCERVLKLIRLLNFFKASVDCVIHAGLLLNKTRMHH